MSSESFDNANSAEAGSMKNNHLSQTRTPGGHIADTAQPALPVVHRKLANPAPLGLLSFATGIFLISMYGVEARGIATPNVLVGVLMFFGGVCQFLAGIMEFISGNTFGATVFPSYGAFNISYAMIYIPGSGIMASFTDPKTGKLNEMFPQALAMYIWAWFILTMIFTAAAVRSSWVLVMVLASLDLELLLLGCGYMTGIKGLLTAGNAVGFIVGFFSYWAGTAGLFAGGITPWNIPVGPLYKAD
ncbi:Similar to Glyoxylate pathway regulator; acc. no. P41943 [Pyronema omphalodes CBS 100304]|uniref:Similar to Glyoxylate pathway regulator acc. no. P41943 n=1 Tax=Pyronema omphalodes (strain CBS 100304) TaxID=1076935 RepID=U4KWZ6_PYROM|nr:Similar to Glyoxylate pathway regulator; acc. no. P41943 [Pyronema omphalodes CBS 100304]